MPQQYIILLAIWHRTYPSLYVCC